MELEHKKSQNVRKFQKSRRGLDAVLAENKKFASALVQIYN